MAPEKFIDKVDRYISDNQLLKPQSRVIVGLSGGADSVALLVSLNELGHHCIAIHYNYHLRGEESNRDMRLAENLCQQLNIPLNIFHCDAEAESRKAKVSIEMFCRTERYDKFREIALTNDADAIAVGHHREDRVETFFLNLMRGSGLRGLSSMRARNDNVIRPLLNCSRSEIESYLSQKGFTWCIDSTNSCNDFKRNRLRNQLIPFLDELFEGASDAVLRTMSILDENYAFYDYAVKQLSDRFVDHTSNSVNIKQMNDECPHAQLLLYEMMRDSSLSRRQTDDMFRAATSAGGIFPTDFATYHVDHGMLRKFTSDEINVDINEVDIDIQSSINRPIRIKSTAHPIADFKPQRDPTVIYLDERAAEPGHRWKLRRPSIGDRMIPYGMKGSKLISDIFADAKFTAKDKLNTWLLTCDDEIIWVVGLRASAHFPITPDTRKYLQLQLIK